MNPVIEVVAIETSGLDPKKDVLLELAVGRFENGHSSIWSSPIDPGSFELSDQIIQFHTETGLIQDLIQSSVSREHANNRMQAANLRLIWKHHFASKFIPEVGGMPADPFLAIGELHGIKTDAKLNRARDKVLYIMSVLRLLNLVPKVALVL